MAKSGRGEVSLRTIVALLVQTHVYFGTLGISPCLWCRCHFSLPRFSLDVPASGQVAIALRSSALGGSRRAARLDRGRSADKKETCAVPFHTALVMCRMTAKRYLLDPPICFDPGFPPARIVRRAKIIDVWLLGPRVILATEGLRKPNNVPGRPNPGMHVSCASGLWSEAPSVRNGFPSSEP